MSQECEHDGQLLEEFAATGSEVPFEQLLQRHGALVFGACYRVLGQRQDAEDATQAVFLTLAHRAKSLRGHRSVAGWLHRVAWNIALRARQSAQCRRNRELEAAAMATPSATDESAWNQVATLLDAELAALPEKYRTPLILHYVEGQAQNDIARNLGCTAGALCRLLRRAEELLRVRLLQRGMSLAPAALFLLISRHAAMPLQPSLIASTRSAAKLALSGHAAAPNHFSAQARALSEEALKKMYFVKIKIAAGIVFSAAVLGVVGMAMLSARAAEFSPTAKPPLIASTPPAFRATPAPSASLQADQADPAAIVHPQIAAWITQLADPDADTRNAAMEQLRKAGEQARPALAAVAEKGAGEVKDRAIVLNGVIQTAPSIQKLIDQAKLLKSFEADMEYSWLMGGVPTILKGHLKVIPEKRVFVTDLAMTWGMNVTSHTVCDGKVVWTESAMPAPGTRTRTIVTRTALDRIDAESNPANLASYLEKFDFTSARDATSDGAATVVLEGVIRDDYRLKAPKVVSPIGALMADQYMAATSCTIQIGKDDGLPRKIEMKDDKGVVTVSNIFSAIKTGITVDETQFVFCAPANIHVSDLDADPAAGTAPAESKPADKPKEF
jgi:RNA polymerase sigma factor (sigma-70 family)